MPLFQAIHLCSFILFPQQSYKVDVIFIAIFLMKILKNRVKWPALTLQKYVGVGTRTQSYLKMNPLFSEMIILFNSENFKYTNSKKSIYIHAIT